MTEIHHDQLLSGQDKREPTRKEKGEPMPKECPSCAALKPPKVRECPSCGFTPQRQSEIEFEDGELVEVKPKKSEATREAKQAFYSQLLAVAANRGRSPGWVAHAYRDKFKVWPRGLDDRPAVPSPEVLSWVKAKDIRFAKRRAK